MALLVFSSVGVAQSVAFSDPLLQQLAQHQWRSGVADCATDSKPAIEVYKFDPNTFILRQNKCVHFEAPFIYVLFGEHKVFVQDTGASQDTLKFPLYRILVSLVNEVALNNKKSVDDYHLLVTHSHSHGDHHGADQQFMGQPRVTLIAPTLTAVKAAFGYLDGKLKWPEQAAKIDLGGRILTLMPLPGHQDEALAVYDNRTQWLLTGDSLYPGRLYVADWPAYKRSIARLVKWTEKLKVSAVMGTHIEMSDKIGVDYKMGATFQPDEAALPMPYQDLLLLDQTLQGLGKPQKVVKDRFILYPLN